MFNKTTQFYCPHIKGNVNITIDADNMRSILKEHRDKLSGNSGMHESITTEVKVNGDPVVKVTTVRQSEEL